MKEILHFQRGESNRRQNLKCHSRLTKLKTFLPLTWSWFYFWYRYGYSTRGYFNSLIFLFVMVRRGKIESFVSPLYFPIEIYSPSIDFSELKYERRRMRVSRRLDDFLDRYSRIENGKDIDYYTRSILCFRILLDLVNRNEIIDLLYRLIFIV